MKRLTSILIISLFICQIIGPFSIFVFQRNLVRQNIRKHILNSLGNNDLTLITVSLNSSSSLKWTEDDEFIFNQNYYDVVKIVHDKDRILYYCLNDQSEEKLHAELEKSVEEFYQQNSKGKTIKSFLKVEKNVIIENFESYHFWFQKILRSNFINIFFTSLVIEINTPPPSLS